jgi:tetratricopeptide (TPR) repeat protein
VADSSPSAIEEAEAIFDARVELYGKEDPATLLAMSELARVFRDAGEYRKAEGLLRSVLAIRERALGREDPVVAGTAFDLAVVLWRLGENNEAMHLWEDVLAASDLRNGPDSQLSRKAATNLAFVLRKLKRYGDEFPLRMRLLEATGRLEGPDHIDTFRSMANLATVHHNLGNYEMALELNKSALDGFQRHAIDDRTLLYHKWKIAGDLIALKRPREASAMFEEVLQGAIQHLDPKDPLRRSAQRQKRAYSLLGKLHGRGRKRRRHPKGAS